MTQVFWRFPELTVRDTTKRKSKERHYFHKYDHWQMLQDRLAGMTWAAVEKKHGIPVVNNHPGQHAVSLCSASLAQRKLLPCEVVKVFTQTEAR